MREKNIKQLERELRYWNFDVVLAKMIVETIQVEKKMEEDFLKMKALEKENFSKMKAIEKQNFLKMKAMEKEKEGSEIVKILVISAALASLTCYLFGFPGFGGFVLYYVFYAVAIVFTWVAISGQPST